MTAKRVTARTPSLRPRPHSALEEPSGTACRLGRPSAACAMFKLPSQQKAQGDRAKSEWRGMPHLDGRNCGGLTYSVNTSELSVLGVMTCYSLHALKLAQGHRPLAPAREPSLAHGCGGTNPLVVATHGPSQSRGASGDLQACQNTQVDATCEYPGYFRRLAAATKRAYYGLIAR